MSLAIFLVSLLLTLHRYFVIRFICETHACFLSIYIFSEVHLGSCQTSTTGLLRKNNKLILAVNYLCKNLYHGRLTGSYKRLSFMKNKILSIGQSSKSTKNAFDQVLITQNTIIKNGCNGVHNQNY